MSQFKLYARGGTGGSGGSQHREVADGADGADVVFTDTGFKQQSNDIKFI